MTYEYYLKAGRDVHIFYQWHHYHNGTKWVCGCGSRGRKYSMGKQNAYKLWRRHVARHGKPQPITHADMTVAHYKKWQLPYPFKDQQAYDNEPENVKKLYDVYVPVKLKWTCSLGYEQTI